MRSLGSLRLSAGNYNMGVSMNTYWKRVFGWSKSRESMWRECRLSYYYNYIGKWEGYKGDPAREELTRLANLRKFVFWKGELIHKSIENQVTQHAIGRNVSEEAAKNYFVREVEAVRQNPGDIITEVANGFRIEDSKFEEMKADGLRQLANFFRVIWHNYKDLKHLRHEELDFFSIDDIKVWAKLDLVTQTPDGTIVITDWKTGKKGWEDVSESLQMSVYILWAMEHYKVPLDKVMAELVYLQACKTEPTGRSEEQLERIKGNIVRSAREMFAVSSEADFPPDPQPRRCKECNFATYCVDGREILSRLKG